MGTARGWLSPHAIYWGDVGLYQFRDSDGNTPVWTFPAETGTVALSVSGAVTIPASDDHSAGITKQQFVYDDLGTLVTGQTYRALYARYNVKSTTPSNPAAEVTGIEGAVGSYIPDEALTFRGGYFRTYTNADATSTMRMAIGCEISARASYSGGTECVADSGTAFVGAKIWMAPYFTAASVGNINNFWGLWIYGEHPTQRNADAAIYISDAGGSFTVGVRVDSACVQAFKAEYNIAAQLGAWVHGVKVELTRTADIQPATGCWFGGQFVLNAGSSGYTALNTPAYALQAVFKGSDTNPDGVDIHVGRFEIQSDGKVSDIVHILANTGCTIIGHMLYLASHINTDAILINVQSSATIAKGISFLAGAGATLTSLLYAYGDGTFTNFLEVAASGDGGVTVGETDISSDLTADAYLMLKVGVNSYKILAWVA